MRIYLAGPMRGYELYNFPEFDRVAKEFRDLGHDVFSPADMDRELGFDETKTIEEQEVEFDLIYAMGRNFAAIRECDQMVLLDNWHESSGACAEYHYAKALNKDIIY